MLAIILSTKSQLKEEDSNATNPIEFSDFSKVVLSSSNQAYTSVMLSLEGISLNLN
jgi:hypothetical protein